MISLVYSSRTSNILRIVKKLNLPEDRCFDISDKRLENLDIDFCILTYTDLLGQIPEHVDLFLQKNHSRLAGIAASGNRNFGENFCGAAKKIRAKYDPEHKLPYFEFELSGDNQTISEFRKIFV